MKYQKYPAQTIKVAGDLRQAPATFENPEGRSDRLIDQASEFALAHVTPISHSAK